MSASKEQRNRASERITFYQGVFMRTSKAKSNGHFQLATFQIVINGIPYRFLGHLKTYSVQFWSQSKYKIVVCSGD